MLEIAAPLQYLYCFKKENDSIEQQSYTSTDFNSYCNAMNATITPMLQVRK